MKKFLVIVSILAIWQNWGSITGFFSSPDPRVSESEVVLYATDWCGYCDKTRKLFAKEGIPYVEYDIEKSTDAYKEYKRLGGRGVPVVTANGTVIHGYSPQRVLAAVEAR